MPRQQFRVFIRQRFPRSASSTLAAFAHRKAKEFPEGRQNHASGRCRGAGPLAYVLTSGARDLHHFQSSTAKRRVNAEHRDSSPDDVSRHREVAGGREGSDVAQRSLFVRGPASARASLSIELAAITLSDRLILHALISCRSTI